MLNIPEVDNAVGKLGWAETPLDPAPVSMIETVISYKPEYLTDASGEWLRYRFDDGQKDYFRSAEGKLFRQWRARLDPDLNPGRSEWAGIRSPDDIWDEIAHAAKIPGPTSAPKLQPIAARIVMLQSGMRAPMGIKVKGGTWRPLKHSASNWSVCSSKYRPFSPPPS